MSMVKRIVKQAEAENGLHYRNLSVPNACNIPGGLALGTKIFLQGMVPPTADRFHLNLQRGSDSEADVYLHFNPRFGDDAVVVRNSRTAGEWGSEESEGEVPFATSQPFLLLIGAYAEGYEMEVNGKPFATFKHREGLDLTSVTHLLIDGAVIINALHISVPSMPKNLRLSIPGNLKVGDLITMKGTVTTAPERFVCNLQCGPAKSDDVVFHFNPRFPDQMVVRNSKVDEAWGEEEREGAFPFGEDKPFTLHIAAQWGGFKTWVDGTEFVAFTPRQDLVTACTLFVEGDVQMQDVWIESAQKKLPSECGVDGISSIESKCHFFFPESPVVQHLSQPFVPGSKIAVSGVVGNEPQRFHVNLQCGNDDGCDVILHYNPRWDMGDTLLVQNSREGGAWGEENKEAVDLPLNQGCKVDLEILNKEEGFTAVLNGSHVAHFPHRLDSSRVDHLVVDGDVKVERIVVS